MRFLQPVDVCRTSFLLALAAVACMMGACAGHEQRRMSDAQVHAVIDDVVPSLMMRRRIPGMAVGVVHGDATVIRCFGVRSLESGAPVDERTLFEVGSVSKTFTALLGAQCVVDRTVRLDDAVSKHVPALDGTAAGRVTLLHLGTYTAGGMPRQVPDHVTEDSLTAYLRAWTPAHEAGTRREYSNLSIGYFGRVCATAAGRDFTAMMETDILPRLRMRDTRIDVPTSEMDRYAWGYKADDTPVRAAPGVLDAEAYGIRSTVADLCVYMRVQMEPGRSPLGEAIAMTHVPHYTAGPMSQGLGWESYAYPTTLTDLLAGNSPEMIFEPAPVTPARDAAPMRLYNKTGSTNGFSAYVLFVPARKIGVVLLANRPYPIAERIETAHALLQALEQSMERDGAK